MSAAHKLLKSQFPGVQGFQSTLFSQNPGEFVSVTDKGMCVCNLIHNCLADKDVKLAITPYIASFSLYTGIQIHFSNDNHWITSSYVDECVQIYDSLPSSLSANVEVPNNLPGSTGN